MIAQTWFRNKAFVCFCDVQRIMSSTVAERAFKGGFLSNINVPLSGPTGADFSELGQARANRSDPCVREWEQKQMKRLVDAKLQTSELEPG